MDETRFAVWRVGSTHVVRIDGVLDLAASVRLRLALYDRLDAGARDVVVDLSGVRLLDASAVSVLLAVRDRLREHGGRLRAPGATALVLEVLEITGAAKALSAYDAVEPALAARPEIDRDVERRAHGLWGDEINELLCQLHQTSPDDPQRPQLRDRIVEQCLPHADRLARRFHGLGESPADLNQVAAVGLLKAVDRYDPTLSTDFAAYATPTIIGELKRYFRDRGWSVRVPRRLQELRLDVNRARGALTHQLNRAPTLAEIADHLGVEEDEVAEAAVAASGYRATSLFAPVSRDDEASAPIERLGVTDAAYEAVEFHEALQPLLAALPARQRAIVSLRFYGNLTQAQIAARLGISQMHVSRLLARTLLRLREGLLNDR
jgi:RNA polymerase sigma-B factor